MIVKPKLTIPSMPVREIPKFAYSGYGSDTVGPARYTPQLEQVKLHHPNTTFFTSKTQRKVFEPTISIEN